MSGVQTAPKADSSILKLSGILVLFLVPLLIVREFIVYLDPVPAPIRAVGLVFAAACFFFGSCALVLAGLSKRNVIVWLSGFAVTLALFLLGGAIVMAQLLVLNPIYLLIVLPIAAIIGYAIDELRSRRETGRELRPIGFLATPSLMISGKRVVLGGNTVRAVEVSGMPESYLRIPKDEVKAQRDISPFYKALRTLTLSGVSVALRLERFSGRTRVLYLTWSEQGATASRNQDTLLTTLRANLPEFDVLELGPYSSPKVEQKACGAYAAIQGEPLSVEDPRQRVDSLTIVADMMRGVGDVVVQVSSVPYLPSKSELRSLEHKYESEIGQAQQSVSVSKKGFLSEASQATIQVVDAKAARRANTTLREIERFSSRFLCKVSVTAACWRPSRNSAEYDARRIGEAIMGALTPANRENDFKLKMRHGENDLREVLSGMPVGEKTILTPEEASVYFVLPRSDIGVRATRRDSFVAGSLDSSQQERPIASVKSVAIDRKVAAPSSAEQVSSEYVIRKTVEKLELGRGVTGFIHVGFALGKDGRQMPDYPVHLILLDLNSHLGIFGSTQSGKTSTAISIVAQVSLRDIKSVVLVPFKSHEWRIILAIDPTARVFVAGGRGAVALHYNFFIPPAGVPIVRWIYRLVDIFTARLPSDRVIRMHLESLFFTVYRMCGWDIANGIPGRPILLSDLYVAMLDVYQKLRYGPEVRENIFGALLARVKSMLMNPMIVSMFNTDQGITVPELLENTTVIAMDSLSIDDKAFLTGLLTAAIAEHRLANPAKEVKNLLVIEEAHFILERSAPSVDGSMTAQGEAVRNIGTMLRTVGGVGLGIVLIDQLPGSLDENTFKLIVNMIVHQLGHPEHQIAGRHARCSESQIEHISGMGVGETVIFLRRQGVPINVQVTPLKAIMKGIDEAEWTAQRFEEKMRAVVEAHPHLGVSLPLPEATLAALETGSIPLMSPSSVSASAETGRTSEVRLRVMDEIQDGLLRERVETHWFEEMIDETAVAARQGDYRALAGLFIRLGKRFCPEGIDERYYVERAVAMAAETYDVPELRRVADMVHEGNASVTEGGVSERTQSD